MTNAPLRAGDPLGLQSGTRSQARDLVCLSHLRWDFVYQRPQHLLTRAAKTRRVFFWEESIVDGGPRVEFVRKLPQLWVARPHMPAGLEETEYTQILSDLLCDTLEKHAVTDYVAWYYTPNAMRFTQGLTPAVTVYDCMDELSLFRGANARMHDLERQLFARSDLVFTGGESLYEAKLAQHNNVHLFPSSIDRAHFAAAREVQADPADQAGIQHPRLGFFGVVDERMDLELLDGIAEARPEWQLVVIGPTAKINEADLPQGPNIHYLGSKSYDALPAYLAGWDVALMPFAHNEATRFISPTKTPEYLAGGKPVVSTSIRDVVRPYGQQKLVRIADNVSDFVAAIEAALAEDRATREAWLQRVDAFLARNSWDLTWSRMDTLIRECAMVNTAQAG